MMFHILGLPARWCYQPRKGGKTVKKEVSDGEDRSETGTDRRAA